VKLIAVVGCSILFFLINLPAGTAESPPEPESEISNFSPQTKSLLLPGWGQYAQGNKIRGTAYMTLELLAIGFAGYYGYQGSDYYDQYQAAADADRAEYYRKKTVSADEKRNIAILTGVSIWAISAVDIFFFNREEADGKAKIYRSEWLDVNSVALKGESGAVCLTVSLAL